jgi:hypothetical protein
MAGLPGVLTEHSLGKITQIDRSDQEGFRILEP